MRHGFLAVTLLAACAAAGAAACVEVPTSIHAEFAPPAAAERSNFRPGEKGTAPPAFDPALPVAKDAASVDAGAAASPEAHADGGTT